MPTYESEIVREARTVARLQHRRRKLRAQLKETEVALRHAKRNLRAIAQARETPWNETGAASKVFGLLPGTKGEV